MRIAFLMDPLEGIDPTWETTSHLIYACARRGHQVYFLEAHDLYVRNNQVVGRMRELIVDPSLSLKRYWRAAIACTRCEEVVYESLGELDVLFLRKNPPLDYGVMELLEVVDSGVFVVNSTRGMILGHSKLYILNFPELIPETHVSKDPARLRRVIDEFGGTMVVKPLQRFGGEGVIKVGAADPENLNSLINYYVRAYEPYPRREPIMVQEYQDQVRAEGDVRILLLDGEVLGAMRRRPHGTDFRANIHAGGQAMSHDLSGDERHLCRTIGPRLRRDGLHFVGIDVIGGKLIEVNCVSPGGIPRINHLSGARLEDSVVDWLESKVDGRDWSIFVHT